MVHTNEFYHKDKQGNLINLRSAFDVAEELQESIRSLKKQIEILHPPSPHPPSPSSANPYDLFVNQQRNLLSNLSKESFVIPQTSQDTLPGEVDDDDEVTEREEDYQFGAVEIRETYDQNGNVIDSQLVDLTSELKSTKSMLSETKEVEDFEGKPLDEMYQKLQQRLNFPTGQGAEDETLLRDV